MNSKPISKEKGKSNSVFNTNREHREGLREHGMRALMGAVVTRAVMDVAGREPRCGEAEATRAMAFILSDRCRLLCLELGIDYGALRRRTAGLYRRAVCKTATWAIRAGRGMPAKRGRAVR